MYTSLGVSCVAANDLRRPYIQQIIGGYYDEWLASVQKVT